MIVVFGVFALLVIVYLTSKSERQFLKQHGILVTGTVIETGETMDYYERLGGNFYDPTVQFNTIDGNEIIGKPVVGFTTQGEIPQTFNVNVYYNPANPHEFYIEL